MSFKPKDFDKVMVAVRGHTQAFIETEIGTRVQSFDTSVGGMDVLDLRRVTVLVGTGGPINFLIAFCFDVELLDQLYLAAVAELELEKDETELFLRETAAETVNIILGHATADLAGIEDVITLTPPVVLEHGKRLHRPKGAMFATMNLHTAIGGADIHFIAPRELFERQLKDLTKGV